ncbi:MAG: T9SS type A sorting domain-containing protein [Bacteroidota bacterium]
MRNSLILILLFLLLPFIALLSQNFATVGNVWIQTGENLVGDKYPVYIELQGDTIINNKIYSSAYFQDDVFMPVQEYIGGIREENDSVYVIPANAESSEELLIYDWTVTVGDTLKSETFRWIVVEEIITIGLLNGEERKQFNCGRYSTMPSNTDTVRIPLTIIEGVGCIDYGFILNPLFELPLSTFSLFSSPEGIRCYSNNIELLWQNEEVIDCDSIIVATHNTMFNQTLSIAPNPVRDRLKLVLSSDYNQQYLDCRIITFSGQTIREISKYRTTEELEFDVSRLPPGGYFLQISTAEGLFSTLRFVKL